MTNPNTTIDRTELIGLIDAGNVTVIDALPASYYEQQHLPGAINLVESDVAANAKQALPDLDAAIVTYCTNPSCNNSTAVAALLRQAGYTNVRTYKAGFEDWTSAGLATFSAD